MNEEKEFNNIEKTPGVESPSSKSEHSISYIEQRKQEMQEEWNELIKEEDSPEIKKKKENDFKQFISRLGENKTPEQVDAQFLAYRNIMSAIYDLPPELQASNVRHIYRLTPERQQMLQKAKSDDEREMMETLFYDAVGEGIPTRCFESNLLEMVKKSCDAETMENYFKIFERCLGKTSPEMAKKYLDIVHSYGRMDGLNEKSVNGLTDKLLPALENNDPQVKAFDQGNVWAMEKGEPGIGNFICHCYASEVSPQNINSLLMDLRVLPSSDSAKLEQNRKEALAIGEPLRSFIHDQHPLVHEVVSALVKYYDDPNHDKSKLESLLSRVQASGHHLGSGVLELSKYDREGENSYIGGGNDKRIDLLRRIEKRTEKINEYSDPPETSDPELNKAMMELSENKEFLSKDKLQVALDKLISKLQDAMDQKDVGIEPNMVLAISWLERRGFKQLKDMTYEEQQSAYTKPWFHSILKFQELTASAKPFDEKDFNDFIAKLSEAKESKDAYMLAIDRILKNIGDLADEYAKKSRSNMSGALWSGNIAHELMTLIDLRPADTTYGKKHREEKSLPLWMRNTGD